MRGVWAWPMRPVFDFQEVFMERIDRLIIKAKKAAQAKAERFIVGFVTYDTDKGQYKACGHLWGGRKASGCRYITTWHDSTESATSALIALSDEYPNTVEDSVIFFNVVEQ